MRTLEELDEKIKEMCELLNQHSKVITKQRRRIDELEHQQKMLKQENVKLSRAADMLNNIGGGLF
jgi:uncharacterized protein (DUF3084 family)